MDIVHYDSHTGKWFFYDECFVDLFGPYDTEQLALRELNRYMLWLNWGIEVTGNDLCFNGPTGRQMTSDKLKVKCKTCARIIEVTPLPVFENCEPYETILKRGNVVCWHCFARLTRRWQ